jgi:16S rRNA (uracil1498-N3)-methyltransferase
MQRRRFYAPPEQADGTFVTLSRDETHHLLRVVRMRPGDEAFVFDGRGREFKCSLSGVESDRARLRILDALAGEVESPLDLTLAQSLARGEKFDLIVQKATELGVRRIIPIVTEHGDVRLSDEKASKRLERWKRVSLEALKQSGRRSLVEIGEPVALNSFLDATRAETSERDMTSRHPAVLVFSERGGAAANDALDGVSIESGVIILIGPEGGWSDGELALFGERGIRAVTLGPRVLRTETAAIVAIALIQQALGDM